MSVFVLDKRKKPLMPCSEKRARLLLERGRARVHHLYPFTIRPVDRLQEDSVLQPVRLSIDPGSRTTGLAVARETEDVDEETGEVKTTRHVLFLAELQHRGRAISKALEQRRAFRRRRRCVNLRYRAPRFLNRTKPKGWLAPSLRHRVDTTASWVKRLCRSVPIASLSQELVRFDMQALQNPEISGIEYQQGELAGYETREYLLNKWGRKCAYCGVENVPLEIEHIVPRSRSGSNRVSNLTLSCVACNQKKGNRDVQEFLAKQPARLKRILAQSKRPLRDAAAVNTTRWALFRALKRTGLPVSVASGGKTKWNRSRMDVPKTHALDALCVGYVDAVEGWQVPWLAIKATGRGAYKRTRLDRYCFPRGYCTRQKRIKGFQTGDMVVAVIPKGKNIGTHAGRVAIRATGSFNIQTQQDLVQGIPHRYCKIVQRADGYGYHVAVQRRRCSPGLKAEVSAPENA